MKKQLFLFPATLFACLSLSFTAPPSTEKTSKLLVFPVANRSNIGSFWGDSRDGGKRSHKGIDIFARKGTPVVATCDGLIVTLDNTPIGGKTLWLRSSEHGFTAYYAHLDEHLVKPGERVRKGQVIGTVGNTGNAKTTPSHLHFGISKQKSWVNPLPYVKHSKKIAAKAPAKKKAAKKPAKTAKKNFYRKKK